MRALSLHQPWASLWASGRKVHETRHWPTDWPLAIHAAKRLERDVGQELDEMLLDKFGPLWRVELPRGAIVGVCELVACKEIRWGGSQAADLDDEAAGDWMKGRYAFEGRAHRLFKRPIPWKGQRKFFSIPDDVLRAALGAEAAA
jgi:activating signal cointegrator 1